MNCVMCKHRGKTQDTKRKAGIIFSGPAVTYRCFRCKFKAHYRPGLYLSKNFKTLLSILHMDDKDIHRMYLDSIRIRDSVELTGDFESTYEFVSFKKIELPEGTVKIFDALDNPTPQITKVANYLISRGEKVIRSSEFYYCNSTKNEMHNRIIIPFYHNDELVGWTARHVDPSKYDSKYHSNQPDGYIFNNNFLEDYENEYVLLVEGPFDALSINGCGYLGDTPNQNQINWINSMGKKPVLIPDRSKSSWPAVNTAIENKWRVALPNWDEGIKDANEAVLKYGSIWTVKDILNSVVGGELRIKLGFKNWIKDV